MMASNAMTINLNYLLAREKHFTSIINFEYGACKVTVHIKNEGRRTKTSARKPKMHNFTS